MSNTSDLLNQLAGANNGPISLVGNVLGTLADVSGSVQAVVDLIGLFVNSNQEIVSQLNDLETEIQNDFAALNAELRAENILIRLNSLDPAVAEAQAAIDQLQADLSQSPPVDEGYKLQQIGYCLDAVEQLNQDDKWLTNFADEIYYGSSYDPTKPANDPGTTTDGWTGLLAPTPNADGTVFSCRYILPDFMKVLFDFMLVAAAFEADYQTEYQAALKSYTARLQTVYNTSKQGIVIMRTPDQAQVGILNGSYNVVYFYGQYWPYLDGRQGGGTLPGTQSQWHAPFTNSTLPLAYGPDGPQGGPKPAQCADILPSLDPGSYYFQDYGVVHLYSGYSNVSNYPPIPKPAVKPDVFWPQFSASLNLVIRRNFKQACAAVGLATVWNTINLLLRLTGDPPVGAYDPDVVWTLREIGQILGSAFGGASTPPPSGISAADTISGLETIVASMQEGSGGASPAPPVKRPMSLRNALNAALNAGTFTCVPGGTPPAPVNNF
jgi:hypothetical protein